MITDLQKAASHGEIGASFDYFLHSGGVFRVDLYIIRLPPPSGFFVNLNTVLLKLCGPFMDPSNANFWKR